MMAYLKTWLALIKDRRAITTFDKGVIAGVVAIAMATEMVLSAFSIH